MKALRQALNEYLALRRSLGYKLHAECVWLPKFLSFLESKNAGYVSAATALEWAMQTTGAAPRQRLKMVRGFARYLAAFHSRTEVPAANLLPKRADRSRPYIYSDYEVRRLLNAAKQYEHDRPRGTYYCLLGLLAVSGLRSNEAIGLRVEDVDLKNGILTVRGAKFGKYRLVPLHPTTVSQLKAYKVRRDALQGTQTFPTFFITRRGTHLWQPTIYQVFTHLSVAIGLRNTYSGRGPRLHDFRHRFAVQTLIEWCRTGQDVEQLLPTLSTFLGHVSVESTYWYLTEYPELMRLAVRKLNIRWEGTL